MGGTCQIILKVYKIQNVKIYVSSKVYNCIIQNATVYVSVSVRRFPLSASILPLVPQPLPDITNIRLSPSIPYYHSPLENVLLLHFRQTTFFPRLNLSFEHVLYRYILINFYLFLLAKIYLWNLFSIAEFAAHRFPLPSP